MHSSLFPWFQPIVEVATGCVAGYEVLARRRDEQGEVISAGAVFREASLSAGDRLRLDRDVRRHALHAFHTAPEGAFLSINLSPEWIDALDPSASLPTLEMVRESGISLNRVVVEITEHCGGIERIHHLAQRYRAQGVKVALDDFGTGFQQLWTGCWRLRRICSR